MNEIEIRVTGKDASGGALDSAQKRMRQVGEAAERAGEQTRHSWRRSIAESERVINELQLKSLTQFGHIGDAGEHAGHRVERIGESAHRTSSVVERVGDRVRNALVGALGRAAERGSELLSEFFTRASASAATAATSIGTSLATAVSSGAATTAATGGINLLVGAVLAAAVAAPLAAAAFVALAPAVLVVGGAAGAAITSLVGLIGTFAALKMGLGGLGDAWSAYGKSAGGGGGSGAAAAKAAAAAQRQLEDATDALAEAKRAERAAIEGVNRARGEEIERIEDLSRSLGRARIDEADAADALAEAERNLTAAQSTGNPDAIRKAERARDRAKIDLDELHDRVEDLTAEQEKSARVGVDGSDQVQAALERQRQAHRQVEQAARQLTDAKAALKQGAIGAAGGIDRFADAMSKLSPNGRALIRTLIDLKPRFDDLKRSVQDRLLAGFDTSVRELAGRWLPALKTSLGDLADRLNRVGHTLMDSLGRPEFVKNIQAALGGFGQMVERVGKAVGGPFVDAFGRLARASVPFLKELGDMIAGVVGKFSAWIKSADESGKLDQFMKDAAQALRDIWDIGGLVLAIVGDVVEILFPSSKRTADGFLGGAKQALEDLHAKLSDPKTQKKIQEWIDKVQDFVDMVVTEWIPAAIEWAGKIDRWVGRVGDWIDKITGLPATVDRAWSDLEDSTARRWRSVTSAIGGAVSSAGRSVRGGFDSVVGYVRGLPGRIRSAARGAFDGLRDAFRSALNWVIDHWNALEFRLPTVNFLGAQIGGGSIGTPNIQRFAHGGIAGGLIEVGERGRELLQVPHGSRVIPNGTTEAMFAAAAQAGPPRAEVVIRSDGSRIGDLIVEIVRRAATDLGGGDVQLAFGGRR